MYRYRRMTEVEKRTVVAERKARGFPWHSPPHLETDSAGFRIVTAACFEHRSILDHCERLKWFENELLDTLKEAGTTCAAWCILPNHYHLLARIERIGEFAQRLGQLHGRTSYELNRMDGTRGRRVWYRCQDRCMRSDGHFYASLNYIHHNPVRHGYVTKWQDWPFSSIHWYCETNGRDWMFDLWRRYPLLGYGEGWDDFGS